MCAVSPNTHIAVAGYRAVVEYLFWFFLVTRLIENDRDFAVFYGALVVMALCIAAHGIYQYIVARTDPIELGLSDRGQRAYARVLAHRQPEYHGQPAGAVCPDGGRTCILQQ